MIDKTTTLRKMTTTQLNNTIYRLRLEREAQGLISDINRRGTEQFGESYVGISTETQIEFETNDGPKTITIKSASDRDLNLLVEHLRSQRTVQELIGDLRANATSNPNDTYPPYDRASRPVDLDTPIEDLYHHGIQGMKWGVRHQVGKGGLINKSKQASLSDDYMSSRILKAKKANHLSNSELQELTKRLQLEKQYRELKSSDSLKGLDFIKTVTAAGTTVAALYGLSKTPLGQDVIKAFKNSSGTKKAAAKAAAAASKGLGAG